jgi:hypothetical protein
MSILMIQAKGKDNGRDEEVFPWRDQYHNGWRVLMVRNVVRCWAMA